MFMTELKTALVEAIKQTFDEDYPVAEYRNLPVSLEFPNKREAYPSVWVDFEPTMQLEVSGVGGGQQYVQTEDDDGEPIFSTFTTWRFQGLATYTIVALGNLEFSRLFDEMAKVMAFGREDPKRSTFRSYIEDNEFVACNLDFDQIGVGGFSQTEGTPWGTDDVIWEGSLQMEVVGEFNSDASTLQLVPLSKIVIYAYASNEPDPTLDSPDPAQWR